MLAIAILGGLRTLLRAYTRALLGAARAEEGPIRELLAERVGDRTLSIAYWLPDRETFVDERGRPVSCPSRAPAARGRRSSTTARRVAAIIHDAELDTTPELVNAAAAAAALALDNERLKADLRARVEDLRISRARIVEAADAARRRLERDLHDGAQQQLVSLALDLRLLRARLKDDRRGRRWSTSSPSKLAVALAELRELARGIHPAILTDRGLGPAVRRSPTACRCRSRSTSSSTSARRRRSRPPPTSSSAEALTNVARYAQGARGEGRDPARRTAASSWSSPTTASAAPTSTAGTGLRGLQDRLAALDGALAIDSPPGEGTRLRAVIPA